MHCNADEEMDKEVSFLTCSRRVQAAAAAVEDLSYTHKGSRPTEVLCDLSVACLILSLSLCSIKEAINDINTRHHASSILYVTSEFKHARGVPGCDPVPMREYCRVKYTVFRFP